MKLPSLFRSLRIQARTLHCVVPHYNVAKNVSTIRECLESTNSRVLNTRVGRNLTRVCFLFAKCCASTQGCVQAVRKHKDVVFIDVSDGSTPFCLQVVLDANRIPRCVFECYSSLAYIVLLHQSWTTLATSAAFKSSPFKLCCNMVTRLTAVVCMQN